MDKNKIKEIVELSKKPKREIIRKMIEKNKSKVFEIYSDGISKGVIRLANKKSKEELINEYFALDDELEPKK